MAGEPAVNPHAVTRHHLRQAPVARPLAQIAQLLQGITAGTITSLPTQALSPATLYR